MTNKVDVEKIICDSLIEMMEKESFFNIKVTDLVKQAGISRSVFYNYFSSIYDVVQKMEDEFFDGILKVDSAALSVTQKIIKEFDPIIIQRVEFVKKSKKTLKVLISENGDPSFAVKLSNRSYQIIKEYSKGKYSDNELKMLSEYMAAGQTQAFKWWLKHEEDMDIYEAMLFLVKITKNLLQDKK